MHFDFNQDLILENHRVQLRAISPQDIVHLLPISQNEPETWQYSLVRAGGGSAQLEHYFQQAFEGRAKGSEYAFIVFDKVTQRYAGSTRFYDINPAFNTLQLGYTWYGKDFRGTGLNRHCKFLLLSYAFETLGVDRVEFRADANNARSIAAMKAIGCTVEGILRSNMPTPEGGRRDSIVLSILKAEWFEDVKEKLARLL